MKMIKLGKFKLVFGQIGNCITNILHVKLHKLATGLKTVKVGWRGSDWEDLDASITLNKWYVPIGANWNSTKLAKRFGTPFEAPFGTYHVWDSKFLGEHIEL
tara:strand:- start:32913 stop:33218 length:306 start_codon:yes stop_codon:yes gene_type:complete